MKKTYSIKGMHCASCVALIEENLKDLDGVTDAQANLVKEQATVEYDPEKVT